jgi:hypothetical protein
MLDQTISHKRNADDFQQAVDLQALARCLLGTPLSEAGMAQTYLIPAFDPDQPEYHVTQFFYRNPATGDRGDCVKFVRRIRNCSFPAALSFLDGWLAAIEGGC